MFDEQVATRTLAQEARGEPLDGQQAVAHVLKNRLASGRWGKSLASVCLWRAQFSGWYMPHDPNFAYACSLRDDDAVLVHMLDVLDGVLASKSDPTVGALFYYSNSIPAPEWSKSMTPRGTFGRQLFFTDQP